MLGPMAGQTLKRRERDEAENECPDLHASLYPAGTLPLGDAGTGPLGTYSAPPDGETYSFNRL